MHTYCSALFVLCATKSLRFASTAGSMRHVRRPGEPDFRPMSASSEPSIAPTSTAQKALLVVIGLALIVPASIGAFIAKANGHPMADPWGAWFASGWFYGIFIGLLFRAISMPWTKRWRRPLLAGSACGVVYCIGRVVDFYAFGYP